MLIAEYRLKGRSLSSRDVWGVRTVAIGCCGEVVCTIEIRVLHVVYVYVSDNISSAYAKVLAA